MPILCGFECQNLYNTCRFQKFNNRKWPTHKMKSIIHFNQRVFAGPLINGMSCLCTSTTAISCKYHNQFSKPKTSLWNVQQHKVEIYLYKRLQLFFYPNKIMYFEYFLSRKSTSRDTSTDRTDKMKNMKIYKNSSV